MPSPFTLSLWRELRGAVTGSTETVFTGLCVELALSQIGCRRGTVTGTTSGDATGEWQCSSSAVVFALTVLSRWSEALRYCTEPWRSGFSLSDSHHLHSQLNIHALGVSLIEIIPHCPDPSRFDALFRLLLEAAHAAQEGGGVDEVDEYGTRNPWITILRRVLMYAATTIRPPPCSHSSAASVKLEHWFLRGIDLCAWSARWARQLATNACFQHSTFSISSDYFKLFMEQSQRSLSALDLAFCELALCAHNRSWAKHVLQELKQNLEALTLSISVVSPSNLLGGGNGAPHEHNVAVNDDEIGGCRLTRARDGSISFEELVAVLENSRLSNANNSSVLARSVAELDLLLMEWVNVRHWGCTMPSLDPVKSSTSKWTTYEMTKGIVENGGVFCGPRGRERDRILEGVWSSIRRVRNSLLRSEVDIDDGGIVASLLTQHIGFFQAAHPHKISALLQALAATKEDFGAGTINLAFALPPDIVATVFSEQAKRRARQICLIAQCWTGSDGGASPATKPLYAVDAQPMDCGSSNCSGRTTTTRKAADAGSQMSSQQSPPPPLARILLAYVGAKPPTKYTKPGPLMCKGIKGETQLSNVYSPVVHDNSNEGICLSKTKYLEQIQTGFNYGNPGIEPHSTVKYSAGEGQPGKAGNSSESDSAVSKLPNFPELESLPVPSLRLILVDLLDMLCGPAGGVGASTDDQTSITTGGSLGADYLEGASTAETTVSGCPAIYLEYLVAGVFNAASELAGRVRDFGGVRDIVAAIEALVLRGCDVIATALLFGMLSTGDDASSDRTVSDNAPSLESAHGAFAPAADLNKKDETERQKVQGYYVKANNCAVVSTTLRRVMMSTSNVGVRDLSAAVLKHFYPSAAVRVDCTALLCDLDLCFDHISFPANEVASNETRSAKLMFEGISTKEDAAYGRKMFVAVENLVARGIPIVIVTRNSEANAWFVLREVAGVPTQWIHKVLSTHDADTRNNGKTAKKWELVDAYFKTQGWVSTLPCVKGQYSSVSSPSLSPTKIPRVTRAVFIDDSTSEIAAMKASPLDYVTCVQAWRPGKTLEGKQATYVEAKEMFGRVPGIFNHPEGVLSSLWNALLPDQDSAVPKELFDGVPL